MGDLLIHLLSQKLDSLTSREWQSSLTGSELPTLKQFIDFIAHRCQMLEATGKTTASSKGPVAQLQSKTKHQSTCVATVKTKCIYCGGGHLMYYCQDFTSLPVPQRISEIKKRKICFNCLRSTGHIANKCTAGNCKICKLKHNTLLHITTAVQEARDRNAEEEKDSNPTSSPTALITNSSCLAENKYVMLSTAIVYAYDSKGDRKTCRILLDCGSQANFISKKFLNVLGLKPRALDISIFGINKTVTRSSQSVQVRLQSRLNSFSISSDCIITEHVTNKLPAFSLKRNSFDIPHNIELADTQFHISSEIDILIGAKHFWQLLCIGQIKSSPNHSTLHKTRFGWVLAGRQGSLVGSKQNVHFFHASVTNAQLQEQLSRFWQIEDIFDDSSNYTAEEALCEQHFSQNVSRTLEGRYVVKLPVKEQIITKIGDSREIALRRLYGLERRFKRNPFLQIQYSQFLDEYSALGHMCLIDVPSDTSEHFYLPHHGVFKSTAQSSKIRVVFDASSKSSIGVSLNDALMVEPTVQQDLVSIILRFRTFRIALAADIVKMYRQVQVHPTQTQFQRILWRSDPQSKINTYELTTVTYGTSSAAYLTTRCLKHLAEQYSGEYPIGSICVQRDFYVDDLLTGADTMRDAIAVRDETISLLRAGAFELSRWTSNCPELLENDGDQKSKVVAINDGIESSILGIHWNQFQDTFHFSYNLENSNDNVSKRAILSEVSRLFDPLGLLGPVIVLAKLILQELWQLNVHWDESVPHDIYSRWLKLKTQLAVINQLSVPRCVKPSAESRLVQIHGFCDASQRAYGACVYIRTKIKNDKFHTELLCSKSRVAPLKTITLPRLELLAALLLARLIHKITTSFDSTNMQMFLWSDSTITLNWIVSSSRKWSIFVANRIGEIQRLTETNNWRHVKSENADILSRGLNPQELANSSLWWHGPTFLEQSDELWPDSNFVREGGEPPRAEGLFSGYSNF